MSLIYYAAWDVTALPMTLTVTGTGAGSYSLSASQMYAHYELGNDPGTGLYIDSLGSGLAIAGLTAAGFTVSLNLTTLRYTISRGAGTFALTFSTDAQLNMMYALGFTASTGLATSHTGTAAPYYLIQAAIGGRSQYSDLYEPDDLAQEAVSDGGSAFIVSKDTDELWCDWVQQMESKQATLTRAAAGSQWTWQDFFKHCRGTYPFGVIGDGDDHLYQLRAEGAHFGIDTRQRVTPDYDDLWNISLRTRYLGVTP